jgi:hypothetical protein
MKLSLHGVTKKTKKQSKAKEKEKVFYQIEVSTGKFS